MDNKLKICAGIVTYNPDIKLLQKNINAILTQVDSVLIVDNASKNGTELFKLLARDGVKNICNKENLGIAAALNEICEYALNNGYTHVLTLDQDSISPSNLIAELSRCVDNDVAVVGPNIVYKNNEKFFAVTTGAIQNVEWLITSASLVNLSIWKNISGFDNKLFIDGVDYDYCYRAKRAGYRIIKNTNVSLLHELGNLKIKSILGKKIYVTNHQPFRLYYMTRNSIYLDKKLGTNKAVLKILKLLIKVICFEEKKVCKIKSIIQGCVESNDFK